MALIQPDIVGNLAKGAALREGIQRFGEERQDRQLRKEGQRRALEAEMGGPLSADLSKLYDPYEFKLGQMFQGLFDGTARRERRQERALASQGYATAQGAMAGGIDRMQQAQAQSALGGPDRFQTYADGGEVEDEEFSPVREYAHAAGQRALDMVRPSNMVPNYLRESARTGDRVSNAVEGFGDASARQRGAMIRNAAVEGATGAYRQVGGFLQDVIRPLEPIYEGAMGALGFTGKVQAEEAEEGDEPAAAPAATPEQAAAAQEQAPAEKPVPTESPSTGAGAATSRTALPNQQFVGTPDPEQAAARLGNVEIMPEDMPNMSTRDWVAYRAEVVPALMMQGLSAADAHKQVSSMQHEGFTRYAQQAAMMLQAGNQKGAARALRAAYQYFPNGSDVKFGFQNGHLVGVGLNEETGEPMGKPQVISPEYLAAMVTNFQDPSKFLAWTKDWRDEAFRERTYNEVTRPTAQHTMDYQSGMLDVARQNAAANELSAAASFRNAQARGAQGGATQEDYDRASGMFREQVFARGVDDQRVADSLANIMAQIRVKDTWERLPNDRIVDDIMNAYEANTLPAVLQSLGIEVNLPAPEGE
jgi:hypothetical protein